MPELHALALIYRQRAAELRKIAAEMDEQEPRRILEKLVGEYEKMAQTAEAKSTVRPSSGP